MATPSSLPDRYAELIDALDQAEVLYWQDLENAGRMGAAKVLQSLSTFLIAVGRDESPAAALRSLDRIRPLIALLGALVDLDQGIRSPMLTKVKAGNAPTTRMLDRFDRAYAAAAMQCLMMSGLGREGAAKRVAKAIEGRSYAQGHGRDLWRVVARWRDDLRAPRADPEERGVSSYKTALKMTEEMAKAPNAPERLRYHATRLLNMKFTTGGHPVRPG